MSSATKSAFTAASVGAAPLTAPAAAAIASPSLPTSASSPLRDRRVSASTRDDVRPGVPCNLTLTVAVLGASGDLAKKKTFPALFTLFHKGFLPRSTSFIGYARSPYDDAAFRDHLRPYLESGGNAAGRSKKGAAAGGGAAAVVTSSKCA